MDLEVESDSSPSSVVVSAPLSGYLFPFNITLIPESVKELYTNSNYSASTALILLPSEPSHAGVHIILTNLRPLVGVAGGFVSAGESIGRVGPDSDGILHVEVLKEVEEGVGLRLDPAPYLQPVLEPEVGVEFECNDVVMRVGGVVVERRSLVAPTNQITRELLGSPLVIGKINGTKLIILIFALHRRTQSRVSSAPRPGRHGDCRAPPTQSGDISAEPDVTHGRTDPSGVR